MPSLTTYDLYDRGGKPIDDDFGPLVKLPCHAELGDNNLIGWPGRGNRATIRREGPDRGGPVILIEGVP